MEGKNTEKKYGEWDGWLDGMDWNFPLSLYFRVSFSKLLNSTAVCQISSKWQQALWLKDLGVVEKNCPNPSCRPSEPHSSTSWHAWLFNFKLVLWIGPASCKLIALWFLPPAAYSCLKKGMKNYQYLQIWSLLTLMYCKNCKGHYLSGKSTFHVKVYC